MADFKATPEYVKAMETPMTEAIDEQLVEKILNHPPFHTVTGCFNLRDISDGSTAAAIRQNYVFRAGTLERLPPGVVTPLTKDLHVQTIFDLRSAQERISKPDPYIPGVDSRWSPSTWDNDTTVAAQEKNDQPFSFANMYVDMMQSHKSSIKTVFEYVRDQPEKPFLFHCTAGKDRTGLVAALLLNIAEADLEYINQEYALTRFGIEPMREFLMKKLAGEGRAVDLNDPKMQAHAKIPYVFLSLVRHTDIFRIDVWTQVFMMIGEQYGDVAGYLTSVLGFNEDDIKQIRKNLRGE